MPIEAMIGIDVGTTSCKAAIVARDGRELAVGRVPTPWRTRGSEADADPRSLTAAARRAVAAAMRDAPSTRIAAVGNRRDGGDGRSRRPSRASRRPGDRLARPARR